MNNKVTAILDTQKLFYFQSLEHKKKPASGKKSRHKGESLLTTRSHEDR